MSDQFGSGSPQGEQRHRNLQLPSFKCSGGDVPPYGVIEVKAIEQATRGGLHLTAQKPAEKGEDRYQWWLNVGVQCPSGETGTANRYGHLLGRMKKPTTDGDLAFGDWLIADPDTAFTLKRTKVPPAGSAFHYLGGFEPTAAGNIGVALVEYRPVHHFIVYGQLTGDLEAADDDAGWLDAPKEATAKVLEYDFDSKELTALLETFTISNRSNVEFESGTRFGAQRARGEWHIIFVGC